MRSGIGGMSDGSTSGQFRERPGPRSPRLTIAAACLVLACVSEQEIDGPVPLAEGGAVEYPLEMWNRDIEGTTLLRVLVNAEGGIDSVMVGESSGHPALDSAAVEGARSMRFQPAERRGRPLGIWVRLPVHFRKNPPGAAAGSQAQPGSPSDPESDSEPDAVTR